MRHQFGAAEFHGIAIVQHSVDMRAGTALGRALFVRNVGVHHHQLRPGFFHDQRSGLIMIAMRMADREEFSCRRI